MRRVYVVQQGIRPHELHINRKLKMPRIKESYKTGVHAHQNKGKSAPRATSHTRHLEVCLELCRGPWVSLQLWGNHEVAALCDQLQNRIE